MVVNVKKIDDVYIKIECDNGIAYELNEYFAFKVPGAQFIPSVRNKIWDGIIRLFNLNKKIIYAGLRNQIKKFCEDRGYEYTEEDAFKATPFSVHEAKEFIESANLAMVPRDYQIEAFIRGVRDHRRLFVSPTASGKSFIIYLLLKYLNLPTLIIVPRVQLVNQLASDFSEYDKTGEITDNIHKIYAGADKDVDKLVTITTWQSIYKMPREWFTKFGVIIGDEAHNFKADSLKTIMEKTTTCPYKFGFTGTLDGTLTNKMVLEGLFGAVEIVTTTKELMDNKDVASLAIKAIVLDYPDEVKKQMKKALYPDELKFIVMNEKRNNFISNLAHSLDGNVLIMFRLVEQGKSLFDLCQSKNKNRDGIYHIDGQTDIDAREDLRHIIDAHKNAILVASVGTSSEGINIKNLNHIIFASPSKSRVKVLQSIGRGLRTSEIKDSVILYDITDDLSWKTHKNHTLLHYTERIKIYNEEKFEYRQYRVGVF